MTSKSFIHPATCFFLLTLLVSLVSWVGSIYHWQGVQSLLSDEGLRWILRSVRSGFLQAPLLGDMLLLAFGIGLWLHSGLWRACWRVLARTDKLSRKERRAFAGSLVTGLCGGGCILFLAWGPWTGVRSIMGGLAGSPLVEGLSFLVAVVLGLMALVYGYAVDVYRTDRDVISGMSTGFAHLSHYFVTLFFAVQFFAFLRYSGVGVCAGCTDAVGRVLYLLCAVALLFYPYRKA